MWGAGCRVEPDRRPAPHTLERSAGAPQTGKAHLAAALVNAAREGGFTALALSRARLLDLTLPESGDTAEEREDRRLRRKAVRVVPVLAIHDLLPTPLLPSQLAELDLLLEYRADRGRVTHFTAFEAPARLRQRPDWERLKEPAAALRHRIEAMTELPLTLPPSAAPYGARQQRAAG